MPEQPTAKKIDVCRLTGSELLPVFDLGTPCVSDFVTPLDYQTKAPLCVAVAKEAPYLAQLTHSYPPEQMYRRYHYRSGTNEAMRAELADVVAKADRLRPVKKGEPVLDIACNDGTLLLNWDPVGARQISCIGIDPSDVALDPLRRRSLLPYALVNDFFSKEAYEKVHVGPAAVVTCIAMFYDLDDPVGFLKDVRAVMADDGLFVLQVAYTPMHVRLGAWDGICHEHLTYWDCQSLADALQRAGFAVADTEITSSNGGSIRVYATPAENYRRLANTIEGMAGSERSHSLYDWEEGRECYGGLNPFAAWTSLAEKALRDRADLRRFLHDAKCEGKTVAGYAASTKANTLLQFCGIGPDLLPCIADRQEHKHGLTTVGTGIPIVSEAEVRALKPDYLLCLAWQFADAFRLREADLLAGGTRLVVPLPKLTVLP